MRKKKILVIVSRYNQFISKGLKKSAMDNLSKHKTFEMYVVESTRPFGSFEIPSIIDKYIKKFDGVVALGCIIKGETNNFELISQSITDALMQLSIKYNKPIGNGIITCYTNKQAKARIKKGADAAAAVVNVLNLKAPIKLD